MRCGRIWWNLLNGQVTEILKKSNGHLYNQEPEHNRVMQTY